LLTARGETVVAVSRRAHAALPGLTWVDGYMPDAVPVVEHISAVISFGPLPQLAMWLDSMPPLQAPRVIATSSMSAETKRDSHVVSERELSQLLRDSEAALASACVRHHSDWTVLRPTLVYGAGLDRSLTPIARRAMRTRVFPLPAGHGLRQPVHAEDLAHATLAALDRPASAGHILSIGGGERLTAAEMFARVRASLPVATLPIPMPAWSLRLARNGLPKLRGALARLEADLIADNAELTRLLGIAPRPFHPDADCWQADK
jgi:nucleoside-diphosphate-sugar epimerase